MMPRVKNELEWMENMKVITKMNELTEWYAGFIASGAKAKW